AVAVDVHRDRVAHIGLDDRHEAGFGDRDALPARLIAHDACPGLQECDMRLERREIDGPSRWAGRGHARLRVSHSKGTFAASRVRTTSVRTVHTLGSEAEPAYVPLSSRTRIACRRSSGEKKRMSSSRFL